MTDYIHRKGKLPRWSDGQRWRIEGRALRIRVGLFFWHLWDKTVCTVNVWRGKPVVYLTHRRDYEDLLIQLKRWKKEGNRRNLGGGQK